MQRETRLWQNRCVTFYPPKVNDRFKAPSNTGTAAAANAEGTSASFVCGSFASLSLRIGEDSSAIEEARFRTNGCGFMIAAADVLSAWLRGIELADLHGLNGSELMHIVSAELGDLPADRAHCAEIVFEALRKAMAAYRAHRVEEYQGEQALICTCFGVSEETVVTTISENGVTDIDEVSKICRAGSGCGSCRMLIQELIDANSEARL